MPLNTHRALSSSLVLGLLAVSARLGFGQECIGIPINERAVSLQGIYSTTAGSKSVGIGLTDNLKGPFSASVSYETIDFAVDDKNTNVFGSQLAYEIPHLPLSVCPVATVLYYSWSEFHEGVKGSLQEVASQLGIGVGKSLAVNEHLKVTLFGIPEFIHVRSKISGNGQADIYSTNDLAATVGFKVGGARAYAGASMFVWTYGGDPLWTFGVGVVVR